MVQVVGAWNGVGWGKQGQKKEKSKKSRKVQLEDHRAEGILLIVVIGHLLALAGVATLVAAAPRRSGLERVLGAAAARHGCHGAEMRTTAKRLLRGLADCVLAERLRLKL